MSKRSRRKGQTNPGWFRKGQSGNPNGRPPAAPASRSSAFDVVVEKTVTVTRQGRTHEITMEEALQQRTLEDALDGKRMAQRQVLKWIEKNETWKAAHQGKETSDPFRLVTSDDPENADTALLLLGIAAREPAREDIDGLALLLEPWAVQAALSHKRGGARLTDKERDWIRSRTRNPDSLRWPRGTET
jgi:hypothetical protein